MKYAVLLFAFEDSVWMELEEKPMPITKEALW
jgi:hypothetical protein